MGVESKENGWRERHYIVMSKVLKHIFSNTDGVVLKGGTTLLYCYGLTRFSEDLDFDSEKVNLTNILKRVCEIEGWSIRVAKNTDLVKRYMLDYGGTKPLKVEVSYRTKNIDRNSIVTIQGIITYNIQTLFNMKLQAYSFRDTLRDLYDLCFMYTKHKQYLRKEDLERLSNAFFYKDLDYVETLLETQQDELIDNIELLQTVLGIYYELGLSNKG